jgi:hypothetical protein
MVDMSRDDRARRKYGVSDLPIFRSDADPVAQREIRLALYENVCTTWRALIEVRFKLLALVPFVSVLGVQVVLSRGTEQAQLSAAARTMLAVIGLAAIVGLLVYDLRNSELHDDLISRGRRLEDELGIDTGQFRGRLLPGNRALKHDHATGLIYGASVSGWLFALIGIWARW